jgi:hypothetical protein
VISSWQVIAVTVVIIFYISLVTFVARTYRRPYVASVFKSKHKKKKPEAPVPVVSDDDTEDAINDELGLE